ncbi:14095_t:CDS:1, partial [Gigaspora rosea]
CLGTYVADIQMTPDPPVTGKNITLNINAKVDKDIGDNGKINVDFFSQQSGFFGDFLSKSFPLPPGIKANDRVLQIVQIPAQSSLPTLYQIVITITRQDDLIAFCAAGIVQTG